MPGESNAVLIAEQSFTGHRLEYVRFLAERALAEGLYPLVLTSSEATESAEFAREAEQLIIRVVPDCTLIRKATPLSHLRNVYRIFTVARARECDVVIPNIDEKLLALSIVSLLFPRIDVRGVVMRPPRNNSVRSRVKSWLIRFLRARGWDLRALVSPTGSTITGATIIDPSGLFRPTITSGRSEAAEALTAWRNESSKPIIGVVGVLNERKSVDELLDGAASTEAYRVLLAGKPSSDDLAARYRQKAAALGADGRALLTSLSVDDFEAALDVVDALALLYTNESGSSGLLTHALVRGLPVLGYRNEAVNSALGELGMGVVVPALSGTEIAHAVRSVAGTPADEDMLQALRARCLEQWSSLVAGNSEDPRLAGV